MNRLCCILVIAAAPSLFAGQLLRVLSGTGQIAHTGFAFTITAADVAKTPVWSRGAGPPPLSHQQAEDIGRSQLKKYAKNLSEWHLREVTLKDMGDHRHWIYFVGFDRSYPNKEGGPIPNSLNLPVLMNGTVIPPKIFVINDKW